MHYFVYINDILGVETNMDSFSWSYGRVAPETTKESFSRCKIKVTIERCPDDRVFPEGQEFRRKRSFSYFWELADGKIIHYEKRFVLGKKLRYTLSVDDNHVHVRVGESYLRFVPLRMMNMHAMHYILSDLVSGLLLRNGLASMYCSAVLFPEEKRCAMIFSPPGMGKSVTCLRLCQMHRAKFLAEDIAVTDGENLWAVPWTSSFRVTDPVNTSGIKKLLKRIKKILPIPGSLRGRVTCSAAELLGDDAISDCGKVTDSILLEYGTSGICKDKSDAARRLLLLNRYLFNYHKSPSLIALSYFNPIFSPEQMYLTEKKIMDKLLQHTEFLCVSEEKPLAYSEVIFQEIMKK